MLIHYRNRQDRPGVLVWWTAKRASHLSFDRTAAISSLRHVTYGHMVIYHCARLSYNIISWESLCLYGSLCVRETFQNDGRQLQNLTRIGKLSIILSSQNISCARCAQFLARAMSHVALSFDSNCIDLL